jgi:hypothetical protein
LKKLRSFASKIEEELYKDLKILSVKTDIKIQKLLEEAIQDLLRKYEKKPSE